MDREIIVVDIAAATLVNRFQTRAIAFHFSGAIAITPDGWLKIGASGHDPARDAWAPGFVRIHPMTQDYSFLPFARLGREKLRISPSGRYVLRENLARLPVRDLAVLQTDDPAPADFDGKERRYGRSVQLWCGEPYAYERDLVIGWLGVEDLQFLPGDSASRRKNLDEIAQLCAAPRADPLSGPAKTADQYSQDAELRRIAATHWKFADFPWGHGKAGLVWQEDEAAFWWNSWRQWTCVGLDGEISPPIFLKEPVVSFIAKPGRVAEAVVELDHGYAKYVLDGSPCADPCVPGKAPTMTPLISDASDDRRQLNAQTALTEIVKSSTELRVRLPSLHYDDCIGAIDTMTSALDRGLRSLARDRVIQLRIEAAGSEVGAAQFFAHVETLGPVMAPALSRLLEKCCADPDMWTVWSLELEDGCQAFGMAAKALGAVDVTAWSQLAEYLMYVDDGHELFFRGETEPHFIETHGWRDESFNLALSVIVQVRGNLGDDYTYVWQRMGLSAAAESAYSPAEFATRMLSVRDRMVSSAAGSFAELLARSDKGHIATYGWQTYDDLFRQIRSRLTLWEEQLFEELARQSHK